MAYINQRIAYGKTLVELGKENENIVVLDADLGGSTMGSMFEEAFPERHFEPYPRSGAQINAHSFFRRRCRQTRPGRRRNPPSPTSGKTLARLHRREC